MTRNLLALGLAAAALGFASLATPAARAATVTFDTNPLIGAPGVVPGDNLRQVFGGAEVTIPTFTPGTDRFALDLAAFGVTGPIGFVNALAAALPGGGVNVIVLQDSDNDGNPATPFNAAAAANLVAAEIDEAGAGFFLYFNSVLQVNRLVFSDDLSVATADLAILARIAAPTGPAAIAALPGFTAAEFIEVPAPAALPTLLAGLALLGLLRRFAPASR